MHDWIHIVMLEYIIINHYNRTRECASFTNTNNPSLIYTLIYLNNITKQY